MTREFRIEGTRNVTEYFTATVEADSFEDARKQFYEGYYNDLDIGDTEVDEENVDEVECVECGDYETGCDCENVGVDETNNPDYDAPGTISAQDLARGGVYEVADSYTRDDVGVCIDGPFKVRDLGGRDDDGEYSLEYEELESGDDGDVYVNDACRFRPAKPLTAEEREALNEAARQANEAARQAKVARRAHMRERLAVDMLLAPTGGIGSI